MRKIFFALAILLFILQTACSAQPQVKPSQATSASTTPAAGYPAATAALNANTSKNTGSYPAPVEPTQSVKQAPSTGSEGDHYVVTDEQPFLSLAPALEEAKKWRPNAVLMQIPRLRQMERNLNLPKGPSGWFYGFMDTNGSAVELYVEVAERAVIGKSEIQQLYTGGQPPYKLVPLDPNKNLIGHKDAFNVFLNSTGKDYIKGKGRVELDFQLLQLEGMENPVWSIYNADDPTGEPLANVDAVTSKLVDDPLAAFRK